MALFDVSYVQVLTVASKKAISRGAFLVASNKAISRGICGGSAGDLLGITGGSVVREGDLPHNVLDLAWVLGGSV